MIERHCLYEQLDLTILPAGFEINCSQILLQMIQLKCLIIERQSIYKVNSIVILMTENALSVENYKVLYWYGKFC